MKLKRIYHPVLNEFRDVDAAAAEKWKDAGWRFTNSGHVSAAEGGIGDEKHVTDTYPYRLGEAPGGVPTLVTGPDAGQVVQASPTASTSSGKQQ